MKAEELRVGNLIINDYGLKNKVEIVRLLSKFQINKLDGSYYRPIKLTEEWFNKLGFKWGYDSTGDKAFCKGFYGVDYEGYATYRDIVLDCKIIYVHQLQNLYFSLTGEELTLNEI